MKRTYKLLSMLLAVAMLFSAISIPASAAPNDVQGHWGKDAINYCLDRGYMKGVGNNMFQPNGSVTRAQVVQVLYNMSGSPNTASLPNPFTDSQNHWAKNAIKWAKSTGVVKGVSTTAFAPDQQVTRDQVTTMFMRYAEQDMSNTNNDFILDSTVLNRFSDRDKVASWYLKGVTWAVQYGFMQGSGGKLNPTGVLTRAQLAQFIKNYYEPLGGTKPTPAPVPTADPTSTPRPTATPTTQPTVSPTTKPTVTPTTKPTATPTVKPTATPKPTPTPLPYMAKTVAHVDLGDTNSDYAETYVTLDDDNNLIYMDQRQNAIFLLNMNNGKVYGPEMLLDVESATFTANVNGRDVAYKDLKVDQIFYSSVEQCLLINGRFISLDDSASDGWHNPDDPDQYSAVFSLRNGQLEEFTKGIGHYTIVGQLSDGRLVIRSYYDHRIEFWDPIIEEAMEGGLYEGSNIHVYQIGTDLYSTSSSSGRTYLVKYDYGTGRWPHVAEIGCTVRSQNDLLYGWDDRKILLIRPTGEMKTLIDLSNDVLVTDFAPFRNYLFDFYITTDGIIYFYDGDLKSIRAIYPNPALSGSEPAKKYQTLEEYYNDPEIWSLLENKFKDVETPIYIDSEDNQMYIDYVYSEEELAGVELEKLAKQLEQELDIDFFDDLINDIAAKVDVVDPAIYIGHWTYDDKLIYVFKFFPD